MTMKRTAILAISATILSAGIASAATCNVGRVTDAELCQVGSSKGVHQNGNVRAENSFRSHGAFIFGKRRAVFGKRLAMASHRKGMYRRVLKNTAGVGDLRIAKLKHGGKKGIGDYLSEVGPSTDGDAVASQVPLPAAGFMLLAGLGGLAMVRRKR